VRVSTADWIRCRIGRPRTYRDGPDVGGGVPMYALCWACGRQVEVHDETVLQRLLGYRW
jgi:hypothetical protein